MFIPLSAHRVINVCRKSCSLWFGQTCLNKCVSASALYGKTISLKKYINQKKMLLIEQLIPTGFSIRRLTEEYSYNNYTTFFKQYKQYAKKSPSSNKNKPNATK